MMEQFSFDQRNDDTGNAGEAGDPGTMGRAYRTSLLKALGRVHSMTAGDISFIID